MMSIWRPIVVVVSSVWRARCSADLLEIYKVVSQKQTSESADDDDLSPTSPGPRGIDVSSAAGPSGDHQKKSCCSSS